MQCVRLKMSAVLRSPSLQENLNFPRMSEEILLNNYLRTFELIILIHMHSIGKSFDETECKYKCMLNKYRVYNESDAIRLISPMISWLL